jgi:hypothetical protein
MATFEASEEFFGNIYKLSTAERQPNYFKENMALALD